MNESAVSPVPPATPPAPARPSWVPIRSLTPRHRSRIAAHLLALPAHDRYLRFGYPASDTQVERYVQALDFEHDEVFGIFNRRLELVAMAHLAYGRPAAGAPSPTDLAAQAAQAAEFGVSVSANARGRGLGARLFDRAVLHARNHGVDTLLIHALSENRVMLGIARKAGAVVERSGSEAEAHLKLPRDTLASQVEAFVETQAAQVDYQIKQQARRLDVLLNVIAEVKSGVRKTRRSASQ